jgi:hypothetical protein
MLLTISKIRKYKRRKILQPALEENDISLFSGTIFLKEGWDENNGTSLKLIP